MSVILSGTLTANGAAAPSTLSLKVTGGNQFARAYKKATQPVSINVTSSTRSAARATTTPPTSKAATAP